MTAQFSPALIHGQPAAVRVPIQYTFTPPPAPPEPPEPPPKPVYTTQLDIALRAKGIQQPIQNAAITLVRGDQSIEQISADGVFSFSGIEPGVWDIYIDADGFDAPSRFSKTLLAY